MGIGRGREEGGVRCWNAIQAGNHRSRSARVLQASCPECGGKSKDTFLAPVGIGLALFVAELAGESGSLSFLLRQMMRRDKRLTGYCSGGLLNPARSFGSSVAGTWFPGYHWIYWVGPFLGATVSTGYCRFVKYFNYEEANPGQDYATNDFVVD